MRIHSIFSAYNRLACVFTVTLMISSCAVFKPHKMTELSPDKMLYRDLDSRDSANLADIPWRSLFTDPNLQMLIDEAIKNNPDMLIAEARMKRAEAILKQSRAAFFPSLGVLLQETFSDGTSTPQSAEFVGTTSWEVDIWGKLRNMKRASLAAYKESEAYKRAVQTQLVANIAGTYYLLLARDAQLAITLKTLDNRVSEVEVMKVFKQTDVITGADLALSEANRYSAEVAIPDLRQSIYDTENSLSILLGRNPGPIRRDSLANQEISADLKYGVPAQLLANRPDVKEAEFRFRYNFALTNVARTYFYPSLTLTGAGGLAEANLPALLTSPQILWNLTAGLFQPVFSQGLNKQRLRVAEANEEESLIAFKQTLLNAGAEVAGAMHEYQTASDKIEIRKKQVESLERSVDYTMELLKYTSYTNYTDVLTSEVNLLSAQLGSVNDKLQQLQAVVFLYQSLGGGWKE